MSLKLSNLFPLGISILTLAAGLSAAPRLRVLPPSSFASVPVASGANGPTIGVDTTNLGTGALQLQLSSSVTWLVPTVGTVHTCGFSQCTPVSIALATSSLANGEYTGFVTVADPDALDAPQTITITVEVGGAVPNQLQFYAAPGGSSTATLVTGSKVHTSVNISSGGNWLSISAGTPSSVGYSYVVTAKASSSMAAGDYLASIVLTGSTLASDNKTIQVALHVTTSPIAETSPAKVSFLIAQGGAKQTAGIGVFNGGQGTLSVSSVTAATTSGTWLSAAAVHGGASVTADPSGLAPGTYEGTVTIASNAANGSVTVPVTLFVEAQGPPVAAAGGVVNNGNFAADDPLAQGDIVAVFGNQFTYGDPVQAKSLPLTNNLGGTQVLVNGQPVPLYYVSNGQINFQIPYDAMTGDGTVSVVRNSTTGNKAAVTIAARVPRLIDLNGGPYAIIATPKAQLTGIPGAPVHVGDTVVIYAIGMGATTPPVASGVASPASPLSQLPPGTQVCIGDGSPFSPPAVCTGVLFAGLTPGLVGLYQINVTIPKGVPKGTAVPMFVQSAGATTNKVSLAVE